MKTKIFSLGLLILFFCILGYPLNNAYAQTMTDAQKQVLIAQLKQKLAQVEEMLSQLIAEQEANNVWCHTFNSNLGFAQSGTDEVVDLHLALMLDANSPPSAPESSYTPDDINTYYLGTSKAVVAFQKKYGITPQNGYVGPNTRAQLNKLYGCAATPSTVQTNVTTNPSTVLVTNITVSAKGSVTSIFSGNTLQMSADVLPLNATNPAVKWSVAGSNGVSISDSGLLSTINSNSTGTATVTATAADGSGVTGTEQIGLFGFGGGNGGYFPGSSVNPALTLTSIAITTPATKLSYNVGDSLDITGLAVTGTYTDNSTQVENVTSANITGFASSAANPSETLTVNYGGKTASYNISVVAKPCTTNADCPSSESCYNSLGQNNLCGPKKTITVTSPIDGVQWIQGSTQNITWTSVGLSSQMVGIALEGPGFYASIAANVPNSAGAYSWTVPFTANVSGQSTVGNNFKIDIYNADNLGVVTDGLSPTFSIVSPSTPLLTSIAITTPATKLSYNVGDSLDITGLAVTGTYTDNSTQVENVTSANITGFASSAANPSETLTVNYGGKTITYNVSINTPIITAAAGGGDWNNPSTWVGGVVPNLSDDVIINPGTTVSIGSGTANCNTISLMGITGGISQISISTGTLNVAGSITAAGTSSQIIFSDAGKLNIGGNFMAGTAGTFTANNSTVNFNGVGRQDIGVYNYNNLTTSNSGTKNFHGGNISGALTIGGGSAFIFGASYTKIAATVTVSSSLVSSFQGNPINFTATLTGTGATPTGTVQFIVDGVNFGNPVAVTAKGIAISNTTSTIASGSHTITANYLGDSQFYPFSSSANITVNPPLLVGIFSIKPPTKTQYYVGDTVSITGLVVTGTFSDGSHQALPIKASNLVYSTAYPAPSYAVNINYGGQTTYFYITIISQPTRIWVATPPTKVTYHVGDTLNIAGLVVLADSSYTTSEPITLSNISGFDSSHVGAETLTITYKGLTTSFQINVINPSVAVTGITLNETSHALTTSGGNTDNITATITPNNASDQNIIWVSSNPAFLTVSGCSTATSGICNATLTASVAGTYIVTAKTEDGGFTATDTITVTCNTRLCLVSAPAPQPNTQHPRLVSVSDVIETMI